MSAAPGPGQSCGTRRKDERVTNAVPIAQVAFAFALALTVLFNGAIELPYTAIAQGALVLAALITLVVAPQPTAPVRAVTRRVLVVHILLAAWIAIQITPVPMTLAHSIWSDLDDTINGGRALISVHPGRTLEALPRAMIPGLAFITALWLAASDGAARRLWHILAGLGIVALAIAVGLELQFPDARLFSDYPIKRGSFSGFFVNRNVTAAYFVLVAFALAGVIVFALTEHPRYRAGGTSRRVLFVGAATVLLFLLIIAVIATASRAGTLFGLASLTLAAGVATALARQTGRGPASRAPGAGRVTAMIGAATVTAMVILMMFGEPVLSRLENTEESIRRCAWAAARQLIAQNPLTGSGLGTFRDVFPLVRDPDCFGTAKRLVRAHNSYLELYIGLGLPAVALLAYLVAEGLGIAAAGLRNRRRLRPIPVLLLGMSLYISLHALVDFPAQYPGVAAYAAALWGCGAAICLRAPERRRRRHPTDPSRQDPNDDHRQTA